MAVTVPDFEDILKCTKNGRRAIDVLCAIAVLSSILVLVLTRLSAVINKAVVDIIIIFHTVVVMILIICFRCNKNTLHASLKAAINLSIEREHLKIRRVLHDLKQPAALILCVAAEDPMDRKLLSALCQQLSSRIKGVTDSKTDAKPYVVVRVNDMIARLSWRYGRSFTSRGVSFTFNSTVPDSMLIFALVDCVERAVENLLSNANKFTSDGGNVSLSVSVVNAMGVKMVMVEVVDDGKGITAENALRVWDEEYKGQSDSIGSGLGLPSVKAFALSEGGSVWARPNEHGGCSVGFGFAGKGVEEGTCEESNRGIRRSTSETEIQSAHTVVQIRKSMSVTMDEGHERSSGSSATRGCLGPEVREGPEDPEDPECPRESSSRYYDTHEFLDLQSYTVLLVEDDPLQMRINMKRLIKKAPLHSLLIHTATEGGEALQRLREQRYDALVTDMNMPVMDGVSMIRIARSEGILPPITKLLSAQTFPMKHFEMLGIRGDMVYDKTDTETDVFHDVVCALQSKRLELCEISISEGGKS